MLSVTHIDTTALDAKLASLRAALIGAGQPGDMGKIIKDESRLLAQQIIRFTPPKNQAQGRGAVQRALVKVVMGGAYAVTRCSGRRLVRVTSDERADSTSRR